MRIKPFIPALIWLIIIFILSGYPGKNLPKAPFDGVDKVVHLIIYAVLTLLIMIGFQNQSNQLKKRLRFMAFFSAAISTFIGGAMELLQEYVFLNRYGDWADFFANSIGAVVGVVGFWFISKKLKV